MSIAAELRSAVAVHDSTIGERADQMTVNGILDRGELLDWAKRLETHATNIEFALSVIRNHLCAKIPDEKTRDGWQGYIDLTIEEVVKKL